MSLRTCFDQPGGVGRFSFDISEHTDGFGFVVINMGVFVYGELISNLASSASEPGVFTASVSCLNPTRQYFKDPEQQLLFKVRYRSPRFYDLGDLARHYLADRLEALAAYPCNECASEEDHC